MKIKLPYISQYYTGRKLGGLLDTYQRSAGIINIIQFTAMIIILYTTSAREFFAIHFPWMTFTVYLVIAFVLVTIVMVVAYTIAAPSTYAFWNQQIWKHDNPLRRKLEHMELNQKKVMEKLGIDDEE